MGLPIWRDPDEETRPVSARKAAKPDATAAARSSIRRRPAFNRGHFPRPTVYQSARSRSPLPRLVLSPPPALPPAPHMSNASLGQLQRREEVFRDYLRSPESEARDSTSSDSTHNGRAPTRSGDGPATVPSILDMVLQPSHAADLDSDARMNDSRRGLPPTPPAESSEEAQQDGLRTSTTSAADVPDVPVLAATGLGDRVRSPSPMTPQDQDAWHLMRSTIPNDTMLPTAESSFASNAASASFTSNANDSGSQQGNSSTASNQGLGRPESWALRRAQLDREYECLIENEGTGSDDANLELLTTLRRGLESVRQSIQRRLDPSTALGTWLRSDNCIDHESYQQELASINMDSYQLEQTLRRWSQALRTSSDRPSSPHGPDVRARARDATRATRAYFRAGSDVEDGTGRGPPTLQREHSERGTGNTRSQERP